MVDFIGRILLEVGEKRVHMFYHSYCSLKVHNVSKAHRNEVEYGKIKIN